jgi:Phosphodiester glycosidase
MMPTLLFLLAYCGMIATPTTTAPTTWQQLAEGLELGTFAAPRPSPVGDRKITILRVDPAYWQFGLLTADQHGERARTARQWATEFGQTAVVNAGMFQQDGLTNVGYMKCDTRINNSRFNDDNTLIAMEPSDTKLPKVQIIDRECQNWKQLVTQYKYVTQGIRMVDCYRKNRWSEQPRMWSMVVMGMDKAGRALLIYCRSPYTVHTFVDMLLGLEIDLKNAMYLEGGPEASLYLKTPDCEFEGYGSYETGFFESDKNDRAWPIPNVIGISPRK